MSQSTTRPPFGSNIPIDVEQDIVIDLDESSVSMNDYPNRAPVFAANLLGKSPKQEVQPSEQSSETKMIKYQLNQELIRFNMRAPSPTESQVIDKIVMKLQKELRARTELVPYDGYTSNEMLMFD